MLIKLKADNVQLNIKDLRTSLTITHTHTHSTMGGVGGNGEQRKRWQIKADRESLRERIKEVRIEAGQIYEGQCWRGKVKPEERELIDKLLMDDKKLKTEYDQAPA